MKQTIQETITGEIAFVNFACGGGSDDGIERYTKLVVAGAVNHDASAIAMHKLNHPYTEHYQEDVFQVDPVEVCRGRPVGLAWFSPDCTHFSRAKGGTPVKKEIRGLSWVIVRWAMTVRPRVIAMENVPEIRTWGPLAERDGGMYPDPTRKGETFVGFVAIMTTGIAADHPALLECCEFLGLDPDGLEAHKLIGGLGYAMDWRQLCAADYGVPTIRERFFGVFRCDGQEIRWPKQTHGKRSSIAVQEGRLKPWVGASTIIDWSLPAPSIFAGKTEIKETYGLTAVRPLAENTMKRIARGLDKFVLREDQPFLVEVNHAGDFQGQSINEPLTTITSKHGRGVVTPSLVQVKFDNAPEDVKDPLRTLTAVNAHMLVTPYLAQYHQEQGEDVRGQALDGPIMTVDGSNRYGVVAPVMMKYYGNDEHGHGIDTPLHTVTAHDREGLVVANVSKFFGGGYDGPGADMSEPLPTVTAVDHNAVQLAHICKFKGTNLGQHPLTPLHTLTAAHEFAAVHTVVVRYMPGTDLGHWSKVRDMLNAYCGYHIAENEVLLRWLDGAWWFISDIGLRMLTAREAFNAMGFAPDYIIDFMWNGKPYPKSEQMKKAGNAVCPPLAGLIAAVNLPEYARKKPCATQKDWVDAVAV